MSKKIIVINPVADSQKEDKTTVWWKLGKYFIHQDNICSVSRRGKHSCIHLYHGEDIVVNVDYDKLSVLLPSGNKI
jgi:hypothetical protein